MVTSPKTTTAPTGQIAPFGLRMLPELREKVEQAARESGRSMNAQIVHMLQSYFEDLGTEGGSAKSTNAASNEASTDEIAEKVARKISVLVRGKPIELDRTELISGPQDLAPGDPKKALVDLYSRVYRALAIMEDAEVLKTRGNEPYGPQKSVNARKSRPRK